MIAYSQDDYASCYIKRFVQYPCAMNSLVYSDGYPTYWHNTFWGNFNGDRYADVLSHVDEQYYNPDTGEYLWELFQSRGDYGNYNFNGFDNTNICPINRNVNLEDVWGEHYVVKDFNGDGLDDILEIWWSDIDNWEITMKFYYRHSTGFHTEILSGLTYTLALTNYLDEESPRLSKDVFSGDFNGDGSYDILLTRRHLGNYFCQLIYARNLSKRNVVDTICNGMNQKIAIDTEFGTQDEYMCTNPNPDDYPFMPFNGKTLLTKATYVQIDETHWNETNYYYRNGKIHLGGKGFLGFGEVKTVNETTGFEIKTRYTTLSDVWVPVPTWQENKGPNNQVLSLTINSYDLTDLSTNSDYSVYTIQPNTTDQCDVLHGNIHQVTTYNTYDSYGNATLVTQTNSEVTVTTAISYTQANTPVPAKPGNVTKTISRQGETDYVTVEGIYYNTRGYTDHKITNPNAGSKSTRTDYVYNGFGNITQEKFQDCQQNLVAQERNYVWDGRGRFSTSVSNNLGYTTQYTYNERLGIVEKTTDLNGLSTKYTYNGLGRKLMEIYPDGNNASTSLLWNNASCAMTGTIYHVKNVDNAGTEAIAYYDRFGRVLYSVTTGFGGETIISETEYDELGRIWRSWRPCFENEQNSDMVTVKEYDALMRLSNEKLYTSSFELRSETSYNYGTNSISTTYTSGSVTKTKSVTKNEAGETVSATDDGGTITYNYYSNGQAKSINYGGYSTLLEYDINGNRTKITDPDAGVQGALYNAYNQLVTASDAEGNVVSYTYDDMGRTLTSTEPEGITSWTYNTTSGKLGTLASISAPNNIVQYEYDDLLRVTKETTTIDNESFDFRYDYDIFGRQCGMRFPSGYHINMEYNSRNYMSQIVADNGVVLHKPSTYNARGQITAAYTNGEWGTNYLYDQYGMLYSKEVRDKVNGSYMIQDDNYSFNYESGNMNSRSNMYSQSETFGYDNLDRLTSELTNSTTNSTSYYSNGNINIKSDIGTYSYDPTSKPPHAVDEVTNPSTYAPTTAQNIDYTSFKKVSQIQQDYMKYNIWYDHNKNRIKSEHLYTDMTKGNDVLKQRKYYLGNYEVEVKPDGSKRMLHYIGGEAGTAAVYVLHSTGEDTLYSVFTDHLGSWKTVVNETDAQISRQSFDAWGRKRYPQNWNSSAGSTFPFDRGYTGHQHLDEFGLINMNGRVYDVGLCRFLSPDPYVQAPDFTQNFNRYSYCLNNPLVYTDPSGEFIFTALSAIFFPPLLPVAIAADIGGIMNLTANASNIDNGWDAVGYYGIGAAAGALSSGIGLGLNAALVGEYFMAGVIGTANIYATGFCAGVVSGVTSGFTGGFVCGFGNTAMEPNSKLADMLLKGLDEGWKNALIAGAMGGVFGGIDALNSNRNFWTGSDKQYVVFTIDENGNAVLIDEDIYGATFTSPETKEMYKTYLENNPNITMNSNGQIQVKIPNNIDKIVGVQACESKGQLICGEIKIGRKDLYFTPSKNSPKCMIFHGYRFHHNPINSFSDLFHFISR